MFDKNRDYRLSIHEFKAFLDKVNELWVYFFLWKKAEKKNNSELDIVIQQVRHGSVVHLIIQTITIEI